MGLKGGLADFPTTAARILFTLWLVGWTGVALAYALVMGRPIDHTALNSWLIFLAAMAGLDVGQWVAKRVTAWRPSETPSESGAAPGDVEAESPALADTATHRTPVAPRIDGPQAPRRTMPPAMIGEILVADPQRRAALVAALEKDRARGEATAASPLDNPVHAAHGDAVVIVPGASTGPSATDDESGL